MLHFLVYTDTMTGMSHSVEDPEGFSSSQSLQVQEYIIKFLQAIFY